jgi:hypothetical protein
MHTCGFNGCGRGLAPGITLSSTGGIKEANEWGLAHAGVTFDACAVAALHILQPTLAPAAQQAAGINWRHSHCHSACKLQAFAHPLACCGMASAQVRAKGPRSAVHASWRGCVYGRTCASISSFGIFD